MSENNAPITRSAKIASLIALAEGRIAADTAKVAALKQELETITRLEGVAEGSMVKVKLGRADTLREVDGKVVGISTADNGSRRFKVLHGTGADTDLDVVQECQIVLVYPVAEAAE